MKLVAISFTGLIVASSLAVADQPRPPHRPPPQQAIDACAKAQRGDSCAFSIDDHPLTGTCEAPPDSTTLACRPDHPPPPPPPPPEAIAACAKAKQGDSCSFAIGDHQIAGTCETPDAAKPLACRPPPPPQRGR